MFDVGWDEMALVAVVALIVIGPKDLPIVLRQIGRWTRKAREMASDFQKGVDDMVRESELADMKAKVEQATDPNTLRRQLETNIDPTGEIARSLEPPVVPPVAQAAVVETEQGGGAVASVDEDQPKRPPQP